MGLDSLSLWLQNDTLKPQMCEYIILSLLGAFAMPKDVYSVKHWEPGHEAASILAIHSGTSHMH